MSTTLVVANVALVLVTLFYAIPTWRTVAEMRRTRLLSIRPRVALDVKNLGAGLGLITVGNIGQGPATDVHAVLTFEGFGERRKVAFHTLSPGEMHQFIAPRNAGNEIMRMDELTSVTELVSLKGTMRDGLGHEHPIDERIDLAEVWEITKSSNRRLEPDHAKEIADNLKAIRDELRKLERLAQQTYYRVWPLTLKNEVDDEEAA